jgi:predicted transcriptional regulator
MADDATLIIKLDGEVAARLSRLAKEEGATAEELAAAAVNEMVDLAFMDGPQDLKLTDKEFAASITEQRRRIAEGAAVFYAHEDVTAKTRALIEEEKARKARDREA